MNRGIWSSLDGRRIVPEYAHYNERRWSGLPTASDRGANSLAKPGIEFNSFALPYVNAETLKDDPLRLLALLHHRSHSKLEDWVPYDLSQLEVFCTLVPPPMPVFNLNCIIMRGERFGQLVPYNARECHSLESAGVPLAALVFSRQAELLTFLCKVLDQLVDIEERRYTGNDRWISAVTTGFKLSTGGDRWSHFASPFSGPPVFDPARCLQDVKAHLAAAEYRLSCLQTDPEYLQSEVKSEMVFFPRDAKAYAAKSAPFWAHLAACLLFGWTDQIRHLRWLAIQCGHVVELGKALPEHSSGSTRTAKQRYDGALTALYKLAKIKVMQTKEQLYSHLIRSSRFNSSSCTLFETVRRMAAGKSRKETDQLFRTDRLHWQLMTLCTLQPRYLSTDEACRLASIDEHLENANLNERSRVDSKMYSTLTTMAVMQQIETSIALSHTHLLPVEGPLDVWNDISTVDREHMPGIEMTLEVDTLQPTEAEKMELGAALRKVHEHPWPKGTRDVFWMSKAEQTRKFATEFWVIGRKIYRRIVSRPDIPKPELVDMMAWLDADSTPEHLSDVQAERAEILQRKAQQHGQATNACGEAPVQTQTTWGEDSDSKKFELAVDRTKPKTRPAAFNLQQDPDQDTAEITEAMEEVSIRIPVNTESLRIFSRLFSVGHGPSKGTVKWQQIVTALCDAGLIGNHVGGSAVSFRSASGSEQGVIVFHKPHPEPDVGLVAQRHMGKRLHKWFGWTAETFVEREEAGRG